jgi:hypothetical protein
MVDTRLLLINNEVVRVEYTQAARKHRIGRAHVRHVLGTSRPSETVTRRGDPALLWTGEDRAGRTLEVIGVWVRTRGGQPVLLIVHVFPVALKEGR